MDTMTLRKVQLIQLEIAKEIVRVCEENGIKVFLDSGSLLGAVRHKGFIPWDDDLDLGMLREDYERFCKIAPTALGKDYYWQTWDRDEQYALPFGKVRKRGTKYVETRSGRFKENGFYVDILLYDNAPKNESEQKQLTTKLAKILSCIMMKCKYTPWIVNNKTDWKVRICFFYYQFISAFKKKADLIREYEKTVLEVDSTGLVYEQAFRKYYKKEWFDEIVWLDFENTKMPVIKNYHEWLTTAYGDYMTPPPENKRGNQHEIIEIDFGEGK